ncbi:MAG: hypothetical protein JO016_05800 [Actinobacteria bacterium]|nr:hypothetical protein [Actinomycetota bacterium]
MTAITFDGAGGWRFPFTPVELRQLWTYGDGERTVKGYPFPAGHARAGSWALADPATGDLGDVVPAGEFSRRFRPVDVFADVPGLPNFLGTVTAPDGTALVDLVLDRNPFMLANGPGRTGRPHTLMVPRRHRDGWSSATAPELAARAAAMALIAGWYRSLDGGHVAFGANDSPPNLAYRRDREVARGTAAARDAGPTITKNPRQEAQHAHLHAFYLEASATENHEAAAPGGPPVMAEGWRALSAVLGADAVRVDPGSVRFAAEARAAAQPWGGSYCSYQLGVDGPGWVMPDLGPAQDDFNRRLAKADGLEAAPDPNLGGAVNLVRPTLAAAGRRQAAQQAIAQQRASFAAFLAGRGLNRLAITL